MKKVTVNDDPAGNAKGWNPDDVSTLFSINEPLAGSPNSFGSNAIVNVSDNTICTAGQAFGGVIVVRCVTAPFDGASLDYTIINLPPNQVS